MAWDTRAGSASTAQRQPGCPLSPKRQLLSPGPLSMGVPTARTSSSCWIGPGNLELNGFQGLSQHSSCLLKRHHFRIQEVCK